MLTAVLLSAAQVWFNSRLGAANRVVQVQSIGGFHHHLFRKERACASVAGGGDGHDEEQSGRWEVVPVVQVQQIGLWQASSKL